MARHGNNHTSPTDTSYVNVHSQRLHIAIIALHTRLSQSGKKLLRRAWTKRQPDAGEKKSLMVCYIGTWLHEEARPIRPL